MAKSPEPIVLFLIGLILVGFLVGAVVLSTKHSPPAPNPDPLKGSTCGSKGCRGIKKKKSPSTAPERTPSKYPVPYVNVPPNTDAADLITQETIYDPSGTPLIVENVDSFGRPMRNISHPAPHPKPITPILSCQCLTMCRCSKPTPQPRPVPRPQPPCPTPAPQPHNPCPHHASTAAPQPHTPCPTPQPVPQPHPPCPTPAPQPHPPCPTPHSVLTAAPQPAPQPHTPCPTPTPQPQPQPPCPSPHPGPAPHPTPHPTPHPAPCPGPHATQESGFPGATHYPVVDAPYVPPVAGAYSVPVDHPFGPTKTPVFNVADHGTFQCPSQPKSSFYEIPRIPNDPSIKAMVPSVERSFMIADTSLLVDGQPYLFSLNPLGKRYMIFRPHGGFMQADNANEMQNWVIMKFVQNKENGHFAIQAFDREGNSHGYLNSNGSSLDLALSPSLFGVYRSGFIQPFGFDTMMFMPPVGPVIFAFQQRTPIYVTPLVVTQR